MSEAATRTTGAAPVVVYDGECGFCQKQIRRIRGWDRAGVFEYLPRQTPDLTDRFPQLAEGELSTGMRLVDPDGTVHVGADAVYRIATYLPRWRAIAWVYRIPGVHWAANRLYGWIAARRDRLSGRCENGACRWEP